MPRMRVRMPTALVATTIALTTAGPAVAAGPPADLQLTDVVNPGAVSEPDFVTSPPADPSRVFIVQQDGRVMMVKDGVLSTFLDLRTRVNDNGEDGLLSIAFAPDYASSGLFYAFYSDSSPSACQTTTAKYCDDRVEEFHASSPDQADDPAKHDRLVITIPHRGAGGHHGGQLLFGPDGHLYISTGDADAQGDPAGRAQDTTLLNGKLLRIDPRGAQPYAVPGDNPFVASGTARHEIWADGLRNPWRFAFDAKTDDLVIADVGRDTREEVDLVRAGTGAGANFEWNACEGDLAHAPSGPTGGPCQLSGRPYVGPVLTYGHDEFGQAGDYCTGSVIGGAVVRDLRLPAYDGRYVYGDFCHQYLWTADLVAGSLSAVHDSITDTGLTVGPGVTSVSQDSLCRVYVTSAANAVWRLDPAPGTPSGPDGCAKPPPPPPGEVPQGGGGAVPEPLGSASVMDRTPPVITGVAMARDRFAVAGGPTAINATGRGTAFRFTLSEPGVVTIRIERARLGRRVGRRCLTATRARRGRPGCTRLTAAGVLTRRLPAGRRSVPFSGRLGRRALVPGHHQATITERDSSGNLSRRHTLRFEVLAR